MDVAGAKALKRRLVAQGSAEAAPASPAVDVSEDAPPVYHYLGVAHAGPPQAPTAVPIGAPEPRRSTWLRRIFGR
jgi:hypothetical protein